MTEWRFFEPPDVPEFTTAAWYAGRERAPHLEQDAHRGRLTLTAQYAETMLHKYPGGLVDLGCGDGGLLSLMAPVTPCWGYDLCPANIEAARGHRGADAHLLDVVTHPGKITWAPVAVLTEMLEHLADPHGYLRALPEQVRAIVASSPAFEDDRSHYEFHAWAWDPDGYRALAEQAGFTVVLHQVTGAFQVLAAIREEA